MIDDNIRKIEARIRDSRQIGDDNRRELISLVQTLKAEVQELSKTRHDDASRIIDRTERTTALATSDANGRASLPAESDGLVDSMKEFEVTHPKLTQTVNAICNLLANMGI